MPSLLLIAAVVCVWCGSPVSVSAAAAVSPQASSRSAEGPGGAASLDQVVAELTSFYDFTVRSQARTEVTLGQVSQSLADVVTSLTGIQRDLTAVSGRLDTVKGSQETLEKSQQALTSRLDDMQKTLGDVSDRVGAIAGGSGGGCDGGQGDAGGWVDVSRLPPRVLSDACRQDAECSKLVAAEVCDDGYDHTSQPVNRRPRLSEPCSVSADCEILTPTAVCAAAGVCACPETHWNRNNTECRRRVAPGGACSATRECASGTVCESGRCSCEPVRSGEYECRLAGGDCSYGRVEMRRGDGEWGFVCDDDWDNTDATVVCRQFGFSSGEARSKSQYGQGTTYYMDNVACRGDETILFSCTHNGWGTHNCGAEEVAGVVCS